MQRTYLLLKSIFCFFLLIEVNASASELNFSSISEKQSFAGLTTQAISNFNDMTKTYGNANFSPGAKASSNLTVSYKSDNPLVAVIVENGTKIQIVGVGIANITAMQAGNTIYSPAPEVTKKLTVSIASQTITFNTPTGITYATPDFSPATSNRGLPIEYYTTNTLIIEVVSGKLKVKGVGEVTIIASQKGNNNVLPAADVSRTFTVTKADQVITMGGNITKNFKDPDFDPGAVSSSGLKVSYSFSDMTIATVAFNGIKILKAGTTTLTASHPGNNYYNPASASVTLTVNKIAQTITFPTLENAVFGYPDINPGAFASSNLPVIYTSSDLSIATVVDNKVHIITSGTVTITAQQPGNVNYLAASDVAQTLTITRAAQTISFDQIQSRKWGDADINLNGSVNSGLPISYSSSNNAVATIINGKIHITGVGTTSITASQSGNQNYEAATNVIQTFQVSKADQIIAFPSIPEKAIGQADSELPAVTSAGLPITYVCDNINVAEIYNGNRVRIKGTGVANISASQSGNAYYNAAPVVTRSIIVKNSSQTITFNSLPSKVYGDADFTISASSSANLPVYFISDNSNVVTINGSTVKIIGAGTVNIFAMQDGDVNYAAATPETQQLVINKASQSITFPSIPGKTYTDESFIPSANASSGLALDFTSSNENVAVFINGKIYITGVGNTIITALQGGSSNYISATPASQTLTVNKASQTITFESIPQKVFGDADFSPNASSSAYLSVTYTSSDANVATILNNKIHIVGVGTCFITATQAGNTYYTQANATMRQLTVVKATQTITFESLPSAQFGDSDSELTASSSSGLSVTYSSSNSNVATVVNGILHIVNAGSTNIVASQAGNQYYNAATPVSQLLFVNKEDQVIVFDTIYSKTYGCEDFLPEAVTSSGLAVSFSIDNPNVAKMVSGKIHVVGVGTALVSARQSGNSNYKAADAVSRVLKVEKAPLTVMPIGASRKYLENNPAFTCKYTGLVNGEDASVIDVKPIVTTDADINSFPGMYDLVASGGQDNNYELQYQKGILLILGTMPLKAATPSGNTLLCINPDNQVYTTEGATFASSFEWSIVPSDAGVAISSGKTLSVDFNDDFIGKVAIAVKAYNNKGTGATSDTLEVNILPVPINPLIKLRGTYCSTNALGDSIKIIDSQPMYQYQLNRNGEAYRDWITGTGGVIDWGDLKAGEYSIIENVCDVLLSDGLSIKEVDPSTTKPVLQVKWNDVIVCLNNKDSIENFSWYKNGQWLPDGEGNQYIWTQKVEGFYYVRTRDVDGCVFTSDSVWIDKRVTGELYPNPNEGLFTIRFTGSETGKVTVRITNIYSVPVKTLAFTKSEELFETDISLPDIVTGTYFVDVLLNGERVFYQKFIRK